MGVARRATRDGTGISWIHKYIYIYMQIYYIMYVCIYIYIYIYTHYIHTSCNAIYTHYQASVQTFLSLSCGWNRWSCRRRLRLCLYVRGVETETRRERVEVRGTQHRRPCHRLPDSRCSGRPEFDGVRREAVAMVGSLGWTAKDHRQRSRNIIPNCLPDDGGAIRRD